MIRSARLLRLAAAVTFAAAVSAATQFDAPGRPHRTDLTYDGRFTFVRLRWQSDGRWRGGWGSAWNHDYAPSKVLFTSTGRTPRRFLPSIADRAPLDHVQQQEDDGDDQQHVQRAAERSRRHEAEKPQQ